MNSDRASWISRNQALVWSCVAAAVIVCCLAYYAGSRSASPAAAAPDSVLVEQVRLEEAADTASQTRAADTVVGVVRFPKKREMRRPVARDFLSEEISRPL